MNFNDYFDLAKFFSKHEFNLYIVGGAVRDYLLNREINDLDLVSDALPQQIMELFPDADDSFIKYGAIKVLFKNKKIDITSLRKEEYDNSFRQPSKVIYVKSIKDDSCRRDFSINALYMDQNKNIYDFYNGLDDLKNKTIRVIGDISTRMNEDPLRMLRAIRFSIMLDFKIETQLKKHIKNNLHLLNKISYIQVKKELDKMKKISLEKYQNVISEYNLDKTLIIDEIPVRKLNIIDLHCDSITLLEKTKQKLFKNTSHIDIEKLLKGQYLLQVFAIFLNKKEGDSRLLFNKYYDFYQNQIKENENFLLPILLKEDLNKIKSLGKIGALLSIEDGDLLQNDLKYLDYLYALGVRMITLTWNYPNCIGYPNYDLSNRAEFNLSNFDNKNGLTDFGRQVIKKMNDLGIIIDVSHLSDKGFYDVLKISSQPIVASHSNSRAICNVGRNLTDDMILALHRNKGVIGINYCKDFVSDNDKQLDDLVNHICHIKELGCLDNIALGSDFDGIDTPPDLIDASFVPLLIDELYKKGFNEIQIRKITHENFIRVMKNVLK